MPKRRVPLALQKGNLTQAQQIKKQQEEDLIKGDTDQLKCPSWVKNKAAKKEFKRILEQLLVINAVTNLDLNNVAQYCIAYANYIKATLELETASLTVTKQVQSGAYITVENPLIKIQKTYAEEMRKFGSLIGLTFESRSKMASAILDKKDNDTKSDFGDI